MQVRRAVVAGLAGSAVLLTGCSSSGSKQPGTSTGAASRPAATSTAATSPAAATTTASGAGGVDVCSKITAAAVGAAIGSEFEAGKPTAAQGSLLGACEFTAKDVLNAKAVIVSVNALNTSDYDTALTAAGETQPVAGVGTKAAFSASTGLFVLFADYMVQVIAQATDGVNKDLSIAVAKAIKP